MNKTDVIEAIASEVEISEREAKGIIKTILEVMTTALVCGESIEIRGFGSFRLRARRMKEGRNPKTGATVAVPAKKVPFFKAGKELKELLNQS
jgi:integration host factor subunit beta